ncbi:hypothetical protein BHF10_19975 [Escherichia coli]|nr:hypothetical protein BHF10_19975 [Escherichia coli]OEO14959.1 hypothetical protein BHF62_20765 [Escherichia coli]
MYCRCLTKQEFIVNTKHTLHLLSSGFIESDVDNILHHVSEYDTSIVFLMNDIHKYPEISDACIIIPEIIKYFSGKSFCKLFMNIENSEYLADKYKIIKYPSVLFFKRDTFTGYVSGIYPWKEYKEKILFHLNLIPCVGG